MLLALGAAPAGGLGPADGRDLPPADLERVKVASAAPDFTLEDTEGRSVTLSQFRGKKQVVLVFYRGYW
jgi:cytochrome oxidase Cu insertion factor (SCO1/SenC/PrrC family)